MTETTDQVERIYKELGCSESQTKVIIELMLEDIKLFDKKQHDYGSGNMEYMVY